VHGLKGPLFCLRLLPRTDLIDGIDFMRGYNGEFRHQLRHLLFLLRLDDGEGEIAVQGGIPMEDPYPEGWLAEYPPSLLPDLLPMIRLMFSKNQ
jgi:hypothetical protein